MKKIEKIAQEEFDAYHIHSKMNRSKKRSRIIQEGQWYAKRLFYEILCQVFNASAWRNSQQRNLETPFQSFTRKV